MNTIRTIAVLLVALGILIPASVQAADRPVQLSLFTPVQVFPEEDHIKLLRFNLIYGRNASVTGLDLGLVNHTTGGGSLGIQWGLVSFNESDYTGWQYSSVNFTDGDFRGFQWGVFNYTRSARGLQLGFVNYAGTMYGLQIGLVNVIGEGGVLPVLPVINWSF